MTKTQFQVISSKIISTSFFLKDLTKTDDNEAYHWRLLAKSQNISERAKITKGIMNFYFQNRQNFLESVANTNRSSGFAVLLSLIESDGKF